MFVQKYDFKLHARNLSSQTCAPTLYCAYQFHGKQNPPNDLPHVHFKRIIWKKFIIYHLCHLCHNSQDIQRFNWHILCIHVRSRMRIIVFHTYRYIGWWHNIVSSLMIIFIVVALFITAVFAIVNMLMCWKFLTPTFFFIFFLIPIILMLLFLILFFKLLLL